MIELLKSIGGFVLGLLFLLLTTFIAVIFIRGGVWLSLKVLPWLSLIMWIVFALDVIIIIPIGIFKKTRGISATGIYISSFIYGVTLWLWSLLISYFIWGWLAVFAGLFLFGVGVFPVALLATMITWDWTTTVQHVLLLCLTYGSRLLGIYLANHSE